MSEAEEKVTGHVMREGALVYTQIDRIGFSCSGTEEGRLNRVQSRRSQRLPYLTLIAMLANL